MRTLISNVFVEHRRVADETAGLLLEKIEVAAHLVANALRTGGTVMLCGNGGSASDAQHIAAELIGRYNRNRAPLRSIALNTDTSVLTCIANDFSYNDIYARQVEGLGRKDDVLIAISTSGQSENVRRAIVEAKTLEMKTIALLGKGGGSCADEADLALVVPSDTTARVQEMHILIGHLICELTEKELGLD